MAQPKPGLVASQPELGNEKHTNLGGEGMKREADGGGFPIWASPRVGLSVPARPRVTPGSWLSAGLGPAPGAAGQGVPPAPWRPLARLWRPRFPVSGSGRL